MTSIWIIVTVIIVYGSLFPFNFQHNDLNRVTFDLFLRSWHDRSSWGDLLSNITLFLPFGVAGVLSTKKLQFSYLSFLQVLASGLILAVALQFAQLFLPGRVAALNDVIWNALGLTLGIFFALAVNKNIVKLQLEARGIPLIPLILLGVWVSYRLAPFVPTLDFQVIKDSLKPLLIHPEISLLAVFINTVSWMLAVHFLNYLTWTRITLSKLGFFMISLFGLEVLVIENAVTASNVLGALIALIVSASFLDREKRMITILVILLPICIVLQGLAPFDTRSVIIPFNWIPFHDFFSGSMYHNILTLFQKIFFFGSLIFLLHELGLTWLKAALPTGFLLLFIEVAQIYFSGHSPEISDPLLALLLALSMAEIDRMAPVSHKIKAKIAS